MSSSKIEFEDNTDRVLSELEEAKGRALETIGQLIERYGKKLCPVGTVESTGKKGYRGGTLRNSITHEVEEDTVAVGTNVEYGPYVELGTGTYFKAPPEWESFEVPESKGIGRGYVHPRPFIRPAIEDHREEYQDVVQSELEG